MTLQVDEEGVKLILLTQQAARHMDADFLGGGPSGEIASKHFNRAVVILMVAIALFILSWFFMVFFGPRGNDGNLNRDAGEVTSVFSHGTMGLVGALVGLATSKHGIV
jgi:hypothetical protein